MTSDPRRDADRASLVTSLSRVARGERDALRDVYLRTSPKLFSICLRICQDREAAEDILQNVYIKVWDRAGRFDATRASPITWLCAIARNAAIDWRRAHRRVQLADGDELANVADERDSAEDSIVADQERARIFSCLERLQPNQMTAVRAAFFDGFTYSELADRMKVPLGTMKSWVRRGLLQLKECLGDG